MYYVSLAQMQNARKCSRAIASFCRSHSHGKPSFALGRAWLCTFTESSIGMPSALDHQGAAGKQEDAFNAALSGLGISPCKLPRSLFQSHRTCPHHVAELLAFFKSMGISGDGFCKIVSLFPWALMLEPDTEIKVSVTLLESALGKSLVGECILSWPSLLGVGSLRKEIGLGLEPADHKSEEQSRAGVGLAPSEVRVGSGCGFAETGMHLKLRELGSCRREPPSPQEDFAIRIDFLLKCGFKKNTKLLAKAIYCTLRKSNHDVDAVVNALMSLGLSRKNASRLIKVQPTILQQKPSEITSKLDYILNTLGFSFEDLFKYASFMQYSLDSHIRPRYLMHAWLKSKRLLRRNFKLDYIMSMPEKQFLCKFVECHEDGVSMYHGFMGNRKR